MKIKNKLTISYTLIISVLLICLNLYIYFLFRAFTKNSFYNQLKDRAIISATIFLEADEQSSSIIKIYQNRYLRTLPGEIIRIYNNKDESSFIDTTGALTFDKEFIKEIRKLKEIHIEKNSRQIVGIYYQDNQGDFVIIASAFDKPGLSNLYKLKEVLLIGFLISIVIIFISGRYFTKLMLNPISDISLQANRISETNLHLRLNEGNKKDELAELSIIINKMLHRLEYAFDLQKNFIANASHELRTPLTSILGNIEVTVTKSRSEEEYKAVLTSIGYEAEKLHQLTNGLLNLAQSNLEFTNLHKEDIRLDELLLVLKDEISIKRPGSHVNLVFPAMPENSASLTIPGNSHLLYIALLNILDNACKFSENKTVDVLFLLSENAITIKVIDKGIGIGLNDLPHVTETFYRAINARSFSGSGIGLSLADKIIRLHEGTLSIVSVINSSTEVTINFNLT